MKLATTVVATLTASAILLSAGCASTPPVSSMNKVDTYILFDGSCRDAMQFYQSVFGGNLILTTVGDSPMAAGFPPNLHARVVHARLTTGSVDISASDWLAVNETPVRGNMNCMYVNGWPAADMKAIFNKLSQGGAVTDPLIEQPFGWYGRVIDRFGVIWMFQADKS